jgi:hypothetical protein
LIVFIFDDYLSSFSFFEVLHCVAPHFIYSYLSGNKLQIYQTYLSNQDITKEKSSLFGHFFSLLPHINPYIYRGEWKTALHTFR